MSSDTLRARSPFFAFDTETGSRRPRWVIVLAGLLAVLIGVAGLGLGVSAANAHDRDFDVSCFGITVKLTNYNGSGQNRVSVLVDGTERVPADKLTNFGQNYTFTTTWDASVSHTYAIEVRGQDGYNLDASGTQQPCAKPAVGLQATECNTTDGVTNLTATASGFATYQSPKNGYPSSTESYSGTLYQDGVPYKTVADVQLDADGTFSWPAEPAGHTYTWTVTGVTNTGLTASVEAKVVGCPQNSALVVTVVECTSPTAANASVTVDASLLTVGRSYTAVVLQGTTVIAGPIAVSPQAGGTASLSIPVPPSTSGLTVVLTDTASGISATSSVFQTKVCPSAPQTPTVGHEVCTEVGGELQITVALAGLTPGRSYVVEVLPSGGGAAVATQQVLASASSQGGLVYEVPAGSWVVRITDALVTSLTTTSEPVVVSECPTQVDVALTPTECAAAGGTASIAVALTGLGAGREYTVTITANGNAVPGYPTPVTVTSATLPLAPYTNLQPGTTYTVTVVDAAASGVKDAASILLEQCPMTPQLTLDLECLFLDGDSLISATIADLADGEEYLVTIEAGGQVLETQTITGEPLPSTVTFQVPNDAGYTVTVTKVANAKVSASASIFAAICDLPTFPFPDPELPTLALTGAGDATLPMLGALGLVQFGVALLALAAMLQFTPRRRVA